MALRSYIVALSTLALCFAASLAPAQAPKPALVANAAPVYVRYWNQLDMSALQFALLNLKAAEIGDERWPAPDALPYEAGALDTLTTGILEAAAIERCDFGWDRSRGPTTELPHLGNLRASGRLMAVLARRQIDAGNPDGAAPYLAAGYRIASHCAQDRLTISATYAMSIFETVDAVTRLALTKTAFDETGRAQLVAALKTLNPEDPFYGAASIKYEAELLAAWMEGKIATRQNTEVVDHVRSAIAGSGRTRLLMDPVIEKTASLESFDLALTEAWGYLDPIIEHWNDSDSTLLQDAITKAIKDGMSLPVVPENIRTFYASWSAGRDLYLARLKGLERG